MIRLSAVVVGLGLVASQAMAQSAPKISLQPPSAALRHEFTSIGSVRELADGRVLVTDVRDDRLLVGDFTSGNVQAISAVGAGPLEYRDLGTLIALGGDTTLMADASNRRYLILRSDRIVSTLGPDDPLVAALGTRLVGADALGHLVATRVIAAAPSGEARRRNARAIISIDRRTLGVDTITEIRDVELRTRAVGPPERGVFQTSTVVLSSPEQAAVFPDGAIAIALQEPYRVEWHLRDGAAPRAAPIETTAPPLDEAEVAWWKKRYEESSGSPWTFPADRFPFADFVPPFRVDALTALPDGSLLIAREPWSGSDGNEYDVVDRRGVRTGTLRLAKGARVVGSGDGAIYVAGIDADGIERLRRHPWSGR